MKGLAAAMKPLYDITNNSKSMKDWSWEEQAAFEWVRERISHCGDRYFPQEDAEYVLDTDACDYGIGIVVLQKVDGGKLLPIYMVSRTLKGKETEWWTTEKEALAIKYTVKKLRAYLHGVRFTIRTDHQPLVKMMGSSRNIEVDNEKVQGFNVDLVSYDFVVKYVKGRENIFADWLSRRDREQQRSSPHTCAFAGDVHAFVSAAEEHVAAEDGIDEEDEVTRRLRYYQEHINGGHCGVKETIRRIEKKWKGIERDVTMWVRQCRCQLFSGRRAIS